MRSAKFALVRVGNRCNDPRPGQSRSKPVPQLSPADLEPETLELFTQATLPAELNPQLAQLWRDVLARLREVLPGPAFTTYLADTVLLDLQEGKATVAIASQVSIRPLNRIHGHIVRALAKALDQPLDEVDLDFVVSQPAELEDYSG